MSAAIAKARKAREKAEQLAKRRRTEVLDEAPQPEVSVTEQAPFHETEPDVCVTIPTVVTDVRDVYPWCDKQCTRPMPPMDKKCRLHLVKTSGAEEFGELATLQEWIRPSLCLVKDSAEGHVTDFLQSCANLKRVAVLLDVVPEHEIEVILTSLKALSKLVVVVAHPDVFERALCTLRLPFETQRLEMPPVAPQRRADIVRSALDMLSVSDAHCNAVLRSGTTVVQMVHTAYHQLCVFQYSTIQPELCAADNVSNARDAVEQGAAGNAPAEEMLDYNHITAHTYTLGESVRACENVSVCDKLMHCTHANYHEAHHEATWLLAQPMNGSEQKRTDAFFAELKKRSDRNARLRKAKQLGGDPLLQGYIGPARFGTSDRVPLVYESHKDKVPTLQLACDDIKEALRCSVNKVHRKTLVQRSNGYGGTSSAPTDTTLARSIGEWFGLTHTAEWRRAWSTLAALKISQRDWLGTVKRVMQSATRHK